MRLFTAIIFSCLFILLIFLDVASGRANLSHATPVAPPPATTSPEAPRHNQATWVHVGAAKDGTMPIYSLMKMCDNTTLLYFGHGGGQERSLAAVANSPECQ